jgi:hypothetical protein
MVSARHVVVSLALGFALLGVGACNAILGNDQPTIANEGNPDGSSPPTTDGASPNGGDGSTLPDGAPSRDGNVTTNDGNPSSGDDDDGGSSSGGDGSVPACLGDVCFLAAHQPGPYEIAVDTSHVYFTNQGANPALDGGTGDGGGSVMRVGLDGGVVTPLASGLHAPREVVLDTGNVYWNSHDTPNATAGSAGSIGQVAKTGGAVSFPVQGITDDLLGLAMYEGNLVWGQPTDGIVGENLLDAGGPIHMTSGEFDIGGLVADSTGVYDLASSANPDALATILQTITIGGGGQDTRSTELYEYQDPLIFGRAALGTRYIYFLDTLDGNVVAFDKNFNTPAILATGQTGAVDIAFDAATNTLYWTLEGTQGGGYTDGSVLKMLAVADAGAPQIVAGNQPRPHGIAVDGTRVYWTNLLDGSVRVTAK